MSTHYHFALVYGWCLCLCVVFDTVTSLKKSPRILSQICDLKVGKRSLIKYQNRNGLISQKARVIVTRHNRLNRLPFNNAYDLAIMMPIPRIQ